MAGENIAPSLQALIVPIDSLHDHPRNPRKGDVEAIAASLERFGQKRPIVAAEGLGDLPDGTIVAGHHVRKAAALLGWESVAATVDPMTEADAEAYLLADNRLSELGTFDNEALATALRSVAETGLTGTGYREEELPKLLEKLDPTAPERFPRFDDTTFQGTHRCPRCGYEGDAKTFIEVEVEPDGDGEPAEPEPEPAAAE